MKYAKLLALFLAILIPMATLAGYLLLRASLPKRSGTLKLAGLRGSVEVVFDERGVPHVYAASERDAVMAVGYLHAQERLWQMDLMRRAVTGRLSEIFGSVTAPVDRKFRTLGLWHAAENDMARLDPDVLALLDAYVSGVNAYVDTLRTVRPPEFLAMRYRPEKWTLRDSMCVIKLMCFRLSGNLDSEILRTRMMRELGREATYEVLGGTLQHGPSIIEPEPPAAAPARRVSQAALPPALSFLERPARGASNSFVLSGTLTATGKPLLANDPHLPVEVPGIWYEAHLSAKDSLDVAGMTIPGLPFVVIGHNRKIAWGLTNLWADCQDLYMESVDKEHPSQYQIDGKWYPMKIDREQIGVRGADPERIRLSWTLHGPIVSPELVESPEPLALAWTAYHGGRSVRAFYELNKASSFSEFCYALQAFDAPSQNFVYADVDGNIGYWPSGKIPQRPHHDGLVPVPGWDSKFEWAVYMDTRERPHLYNPKGGSIITANNRVIEDPRYVFTQEFESVFRARRLAELLTAQGQQRGGSSEILGILRDVSSLESELYRPVWSECAKDATGEEKAALDILLDWNGMLDEKSGAAAALYESFRLRLMEYTLADELGDLFPDFMEYQGERMIGVLAILDRPDSPWWDDRGTADKRESMQDVFSRSLADAYASLAKMNSGALHVDWTTMHELRLQHILGANKLLGRLFNRGPYPYPGDGETVNNSDYSYKQPFGVTMTASCRIVMDASNWDASVSILPMGQSGHPLDRHYADQTGRFLNGEATPMPFTKAAVERARASTLTLVP